MASKRGSKKKPAWQPTPSSRDRMLSSFRLRKRKEDMSLFDMTTTTQTGESFDSVGVQGRIANSLTLLDSETATGRGDGDGGEGMDMMRVPSGLTPMAASYVCPCHTTMHPRQASQVPDYHASWSSA